MACWLGGMFALVSFGAQASVVESGCRYDHIPQEGIEYLDIRLTHPDGKTRDWRPYVTESGERMPTWLIRHDPDRVHAISREMEWRKARLLSNEFMERDEERWGDSERVRYYSAFTESCNEVFLRVPVEYSPFANQLAPQDDRNDGSLDFSPLQNALDMVLLKDWEALKEHVGKPVMVIANPHGGVSMLSQNKRQKAYAEPFTWFTLSGVSRHALVVDEEKLSGIHLLVEDREGNTWRMPWQPDRLYLGNPFRQKDVREEHHDAIREGRLVNGMTQAEVALVTGAPAWERYYPIYRDEHGEGRFIVDESHRRDGMTKGRRDLPGLEDAPIGKETGWFFPEIMGTEEHLRFDENGFLDLVDLPRVASRWLDHAWLERYKPSSN